MKISCFLTLLAIYGFLDSGIGGSKKNYNAISIDQYHIATIHYLDLITP